MLIERTRTKLANPLSTIRQIKIIERIMRVQIYLKNQTVPQIYHFSLEEFQRLLRDFEQYLKEGSPRKGFYSHFSSPDSKEIKSLFLEFDAISLIG